MGYLGNDGNTLTYEQSKQYQEKIKKHEDIQKNSPKEYQIDYNDQAKILYWGDEIEQHIINFDHQNKKVRIQCDIQYLFDKKDHFQNNCEFTLHQEYGQWMIETTPNGPYRTGYVLDCNNIKCFKCNGTVRKIVKNMRLRTQSILSVLKENDEVLSTPIFMGLGVLDHAILKPNLLAQNKGLVNDVTQSLFVDDRIINEHPRFPTLARNVKERRGEKVNIKVPIFKDIKTDLVNKTIDEPEPGFIYMDAMAFGMGSACVQSTFSTKNFQHARWVYDQLSILSPLFLAITAGSPISKGKLMDIDTRWDIIADSVDCRTKEERSEDSEQYIPKSRYGSISFFISNDQRNLPVYNDSKFKLNTDIMDFAKKYAADIDLPIDQQYLQQIGFLFVRDAISVFEQKIDLDNKNSTIHFENIQSTNWNSVRIKPPPSFDAEIGWRVEFRTMELQLTDDENAAISILSQQFVRMLMEDNIFKLNLYIPISILDENFQRAKQVDAAVKGKFWFRTNVLDDGEPILEEMTLQEIFFGKKNGFEGLKFYKEKFCIQFCKDAGIQINQCKLRCKYESDVELWQYLEDKVSGQRLTLASYIRKYVQNHKLYKQDSIVNDEIIYDLCRQLVAIQKRQLNDHNFNQIFDIDLDD